MNIIRLSEIINWDWNKETNKKSSVISVDLNKDDAC